MSSNKKGYVSFVLHAHLPFVHHPESTGYIEEQWLFEAISETYIPLLLNFKKLEEENVDFRITMSMTPPLLTMLDNKLLQKRYMPSKLRFHRTTHRAHTHHAASNRAAQPEVSPLPEENPAACAYEKYLLPAPAITTDELTFSFLLLSAEIGMSAYIKYLHHALYSIPIILFSSCASCSNCKTASP